MKNLLILLMLLVAATGYSQSKFKSVQLKPSDTPSNPKQGEMYFSKRDSTAYMYKGQAWEVFNNASDVATNSTQLQDSLWHSRTATASDTIDLTDKGGKVYMNVAGANNLTVVANSIKAFPTGTEITVVNWGAGQTTIVAGAGVTVNSADAALSLRVQYSAATLIKKETDIWYLVGDIE